MVQEDALLSKTKKMIDSLKTVCADAGLANDSSEYKIITESFLYKFLNDRFLYELGKLDKFAGKDNIEEAYLAMSEEDRELALMELDEDTAIIAPEFLISELFNESNKTAALLEDGEKAFHEKFDDALKGISIENRDIFSVRTGGGSAIDLFSGLSRFIVEENKRDEFAKNLVTVLASFSFSDVFGERYDFFAAVFEYLISDYNKDSGTYGEYFTPHAIASIIAKVLVPNGDSNVTVYDPAAGSGTLALAIAHEIGENNCTIYTQDRSQKANEFMRLNLILNSLVHSLPNVVNDDTLANPRHNLPGGQDVMKFDYIVSNPPFNVDFSNTRDKLAGEGYRKRFWSGVPKIPNKKKEGMAIYLMFLQHIVYSLKDGGKAAVVVPTGFLTAKDKIALGIRKHIVDEGMLRGVISMPSNIFANTGTNVSILFIDDSVKHEDALLMDASKLGAKAKVDGKNQRTVLSDAEVAQIIETFNAREEIDEFSVIAPYSEIVEKGYSFSAGQYFEVKLEYVDITPEEFNEQLARRMTTLDTLFGESMELEAEIKQQLGGLKFA